ncbi:sensor histidine kinase KdpD [Clostridium sp.]|uniref:sensor histidine kinase n=2 Tax=Clostridium TaxID=1485 RepID=UPI0025BC035D|nr:HAMP domain-containing sensor histidine kinase [Clostridium sp.]MCI9302849.1 HAMP domain-containing histidine kinase [Clostridium sp.]
MKGNIYKIGTIIEGILILTTIIFNIIIYILVKNIKLSFIVFIFSMFIIVIFFIYRFIYKKYMENIFINLSNMLSTIIDIREDIVFSTIEDSLFSKLQHQTIKLTNILKNKNKQIEEERNEIQELISDIAHQLKTPLTNLKMYGEFLKDESLSEDERKEFFEIVMYSLNRLSFLVESMIKMSRLESGVITLRPNLSNLNDTLLMSINQVQKKAKEKKININLEEVDKIKIYHDKNWISEAIFNLLENAVKYSTNNSKIDIKIQSYEMFVRIDVKDNGIGIQEDELPKIFRRFYRGSNVEDIEGIGIGLYLTREIVNKHGGYIKVKSNNNGSIFSIFLPNKY